MNRPLPPSPSACWGLVLSSDLCASSVRGVFHYGGCSPWSCTAEAAANKASPISRISVGDGAQQVRWRLGRRRAARLPSAEQLAVVVGEVTAPGDSAIMQGAGPSKSSEYWLHEPWEWFLAVCLVKNKSVLFEPRSLFPVSERPASGEHDPPNKQQKNTHNFVRCVLLKWAQQRCDSGCVTQSRWEANGPPQTHPHPTHRYTHTTAQRDKQQYVCMCWGLRGEAEWQSEHKENQRVCTCGRELD